MLAFIRKHIAGKILAGYASALLLVLVLNIGVWLYTTNINKRALAQLETVNTQAELWHTINDAFAEARQAATRYEFTGQQDVLDDFYQSLATLQTALATLNQMQTSAPYTLQVTKLEQSVTRYQEDYTQLVTLIQERERIQREVLNIQYQVLSNAIAALRVHLNTTPYSDQRLFLSLNNAQNAYQEMHLYTNQYTDRHDERYTVLVHNRGRDARQYLESLRLLLTESEQRHNVQQAEQALALYLQGFTSIQQSLRAQRELQRSQLNADITAITSASNALEEIIHDYGETLQNNVQQQVLQAQILQIGISLLAAFIGLLLAFQIARQITRPLEEAAKTARHLANEDLHTLQTHLDALSRGQIPPPWKAVSHPIAVDGEDEIASLITAFNSIIAAFLRTELAFQRMASYLQEMAEVAANIATGKLDTRVTPRSPQDLLGNAIAAMLTSLQGANQRIRRQVRRLQTLHAIEQLMLTSNDIESILTTFAQEAGNYLDIARINVWSCTPGGSLRLTATFERGNAPLYEEEVHALLHQALNLKEPFFVEASANSKYPLPPHCEEIFLFPLILSNEEVSGLLEVRTASKPALPDEWYDFLSALPGEIAIALERKALIENLEAHVVERTIELEIARRKEREQRLLAEAGREIILASNKHLPAETLYRTILQQTMHITNGQAAALLLLDEENMVSVAAALPPEYTSPITQFTLPDPFPMQDAPHLQKVWKTLSACTLDTYPVPSTVRPQTPPDQNPQFLVAPLTEQENVLGFLVVALANEKNGTTVLQFLNTLATHAASAIVAHHLHERLQALALTDGLTGIFNRRSLMRIGANEIRTASQRRAFSLLMLDIDHFKRINDTYGHLAGDRVLQELTKACIRLLRDEDVIGRYGGEEFVIVLPGTPLNGALHVAQRIQEQLKSMTIPTEDGRHIHITVSIGVATWDTDVTTFEALINRADEALYQAKANGRNRIEIWSGKPTEA
ncbi:MAG: diguanylate cyclase [Anaerolineae bacterium]|nr:MAG: diguanylate cyclase [Anaerolineae bacterium]